MGLSFHYSGKIKEAKMLAPLVAEVIDFAKVHKLDYEADIFGQEFPQGELSKYQNDKELYGVYFGPEGCEPIFLTFVRNGRLCSPVQFMIHATPENDDFFYTISTKTQYAGVEPHVLVIDFLRHISKKYFSEFELQDEGQYWETQDKKLLKEIFDKYERGLDILTANLEMIPKKDGESIEDFITRMATKTHKKLDSEKPE